MSRVPITKEGEIILKERLTKLKFVDRPQISEAIAEARAHGDLKEMLNIMQQKSSRD